MISCTRPLVIVLSFVSLLAPRPGTASAHAQGLAAAGQRDQDHEREPGPDRDDRHRGHSHTDPLHFLHPLVTESPLPENEARLAFTFANLAGDEGREFSLAGTVELSPVRWFSVEFAAPLTHLNPEAGDSATRFGDLSVGIKFASFALEEHGVLLAAGLEVGLPTGNEERGIGSDHVVEIEPWVGAGFKRGAFEWVARIGLGIPTNQNGQREADAELEWATSFLVHIIDHRLAALVEIDGLRVFGEEEDGFNSVAITPGVRLFPFDNPDLSLGVGVRLPLTSDRDSHVQTIFTLFFHF